eukprot:m51a1_g2030 hypothetical protein (304) ;mRNA; f:1317017-1324428
MCPASEITMDVSVQAISMIAMLLNSVLSMIPAFQAASEITMDVSVQAISMIAMLLNSVLSVIPAFQPVLFLLLQVQLFGRLQQTVDWDFMEDIELECSPTGKIVGKELSRLLSHIAALYNSPGAGIKGVTFTRSRFLVLGVGQHDGSNILKEPKQFLEAARDPKSITDAMESHLSFLPPYNMHVLDLRDDSRMLHYQCDGEGDARAVLLEISCDSGRGGPLVPKATEAVSCWKEGALFIRECGSAASAPRDVSESKTDEMYARILIWDLRGSFPCVELKSSLPFDAKAAALSLVALQNLCHEE